MDDMTKKYSIDTTDYQVGQDNIQKWGLIYIILYLE